MRLVFALAFALTAPLCSLTAQQRLTADTDVRASPSGNTVATLKGGTSWTTGTTRSGWTQLTIQGWVETSRFAGPRDTFPESIGGDNTLRIREEPSLNGRILGEFRGGAGLRVVERRANWARIRRDVWVPAGALAPVGRPTAGTTRAPGTAAAPAPATGAAPTPATPSGGRATTTAPPASSTEAGPATALPAASSALRADAPVSLRSAPGGETLGELAAGAVVEPKARDRGWVKVQLDAWVPESLFVPADSAYRPELAAADLRLDPVGTRGRIVRWEVQVVGLQYADPLRRDLAANEPFLLAVGPKGEDVMIYVAVPASLLEQAKALPPMASVILTARVRTGRSQPTGAPVLELQSLLRKSDR